MRANELESLYRARLPEFRRVAAAIAGDRERGRDAVQEAFARALRERSSFRGEGALEAWVWRIVVNTARNERRRGSASTRAAHASAAPGANGHDPEVELPLHLLTDRQREVLFLRYYADLEYGDIAAALEIASGTVAATLHAAHERLRSSLKEARR